MGGTRLASWETEEIRIKLYCCQSTTLVRWESMVEGPFWHEGTEMVCRELQPASELPAVNVAAEYRVRCIEEDGTPPTLAT